MDVVETKFFASQNLQPFLWRRHIDNIFYIDSRRRKTRLVS